MRKYTVSTTADVDMTPMLDIVFIMLIFFIVASSFIKESAVDLTPLTKSTESDDTEAPLVVTLNAIGQVEIDGRSVHTPLLSANVEAWMLDKQTPSVVIVADQAANTAQLVAVTDQIRQAGISNIKLQPQI